MRLDHALDLYVQQLRADGRSEHTVRQYQRHVRLLHRWLGGQVRVEDLTHEHLAQFLNADVARNRPDGRTKKATATNALRSSLRTFFAYAHAAGLTATNPARLVRRARCGSAPPRGLSREEQDRLLATLAQAQGESAARDHALFSTMLATGVRVGSMLGVNIEDIDLTRGEILLRVAKGDTPLVVFINARITEILRRYIAGRVAGPLWESRHGVRLSSRQLTRRLWFWLARADCRRFSPHSLRHSLAARIYAHTHDLLAVQAALQHRSIASSAVYARIDGQRLRGILERIE